MLHCAQRLELPKEGFELEGSTKAAVVDAIIKQLCSVAKEAEVIMTVSFLGKGSMTQRALRREWLKTGLCTTERR